jgi:hypothetical protein
MTVWGRDAPLDSGGVPTGSSRPEAEVSWIEMSFPKLPFNSAADTFMK